MASAEEPSSTVLHRLIQEQLRYGNPTDARTLLAIQQQALRGAGSNGSGGEATGSPRSSLESLCQEEAPFPRLSARQEPQGQEHQVDYRTSENGFQLYQLHGEELPTYEQAKAQSLWLSAAAQVTAGPGKLLAQEAHLREGAFLEEGEQGLSAEVKRGHARSLSEHLARASLERRTDVAKSSSHSYPELGCYATPAGRTPEERCPPPEYGLGFVPAQSQEPLCIHREATQSLQNQQHRYAPLLQPAESGYGAYLSAAPGGLEEPGQVELLLMENERLRQEVDGHREKAGRVQKLEQEIQRISEEYETLMQGSSKRESLEQTLRNRLLAEIRRLQDFNRDLRESLESARSHAAKEVEVADHNQHIMAELLEQNEEQHSERERVEREVQRLRSAMEDMSLRAEHLEEALDSARGRGRQLEEELRRKRAYVEKVERLQSALAQLQATCEKRESLEMRLRTRLEQELKNLRAQQRQSQPPGVTVSSLHQRLREREERILALEADTVRWEQKYLEESTMRQFAMDVAATAAAQRDTTIINHSPCTSSNNSFNEDLPVANYRNQEMENRIRALYAQILEKDAVIKILHQRLHQDQGGRVALCPRTELLSLAGGATLRAASSTPSISTTTCLSKHRGKSLSDDQTLLPEPQPIVEAKTKVSMSGNKLTTGEAVLPLNLLRGLEDLDSEAVEIFI